MTKPPRRRGRVERVLETVVGVILIAALVRVRLLPVPVLILSLPFLVMLATKPVLRRLAIRNIVRRPRETALVVLGSMLGTAIITSSFVVGDSLDASLKRGAFTKLGPVDVVVSTAIENAAAVEAALDAAAPEGLDGRLSLTTLDVIVATSGSNPKAEPAARLLETDFRAARSFGGDPAATGISGQTPKRGDVVVGEDLAGALAVAAGDRVVVHAYGIRREFTVARVLPQMGVAGFTPGSQSSRSPVLFAAPGTAAELQSAASRPGSPPSALVALSIEGGVLDGLARSESIEDDITQVVAAVPARVTGVKKGLVDTAAALGDQFTQLFGMIGVFAVLAGVLLLVVIFVMLSEERQSELGMLRAVGLRRAGLVGSFSLEGWMYALLASTVGSLAGLGIGRVIVGVAAPIFAGGSPGSDESLELTYAASRASTSGGFLIGFTIALVTVVLISIWIAKLNVIRAIRELPDPPTTRRRVLGLVVSVVVALIGLMTTRRGFTTDAAVPTLIGPGLLALGIVPVLARVLPRRPTATVAAAAVLAWGVFAFDVVGRTFRRGGIEVFLGQGLLLTCAAVALVAQNQSTIGAVLRKVAGGSRAMATRLGLAYPLARPFRTTLTLTMFALVMYMLASITVFSQLFGGQVDEFTKRISGGFDLLAVSNPTNPIPADQLAARPGVEKIAAIAEVGAEFDTRLTDGFMGWPAAAFDATFIEESAPELEARDARFPTDRAAYEAVLADPTLFIPGSFFLERGGGPPRRLDPGDEVVMRDPLSGRTKTVTVAAVAQSGFGNLAPLMSYEALGELYGDRLVPNKFYVAVPDGTDPAAVASSINGRFIPNGAEAKAFSDLVADNLGQQQQFFKLMQGYLALGLLVGIAGLGVVMVRAVRERRREIGILRSLGFEASSVRRAFVTESGFVALEGIAIGAVLAIVTAWRLVGSANFGESLAFTVPWLPLGVLVAGTMIAALVATAAPAQQASRIRPAVALRITTD